jgi:hypothetical protein
MRTQVLAMIIFWGLKLLGSRWGSLKYGLEKEKKRKAKSRMN